MDGMDAEEKVVMVGALLLEDRANLWHKFGGSSYRLLTRAQHGWFRRQRGPEGGLTNLPRSRCNGAGPDGGGI
jgi:hypothetical protein